MQAISMELVCQMDEIPEIHEFLSHVLRSTIQHEDNRQSLAKLAEELVIPLEKLSSYVWLQTYITELRESTDDVLSLEVVAQQFGINLYDLQAYLDERSQQINEDLYTDPETGCVEIFTPIEWDGDEAFLSEASHYLFGE